MSEKFWLSLIGVGFLLEITAIVYVRELVYIFRKWQLKRLLQAHYKSKVMQAYAEAMRKQNGN